MILFYYQLQLATSTVRYGHGVTQEVGLDLTNMKSKLVGVFTDENVSNNLHIARIKNCLQHI